MPNYQCFAKDCKNTSKNSAGLRFFVFPIDKEKRQVWLALCGKSEVIDDHIEAYTPKSLCANHFEIDQYTDETKSFLRLTAVPTIFSFSSSIQIKDEHCESADNEVTLYDPDKHNPKELEMEKEKEKNVPSTSKSSTVAASSSVPAGIPGGKVISTQVTPSGGVKKLISVPRHIFEAMQKQGRIKSTTNSVTQKQVNYMRVALNTGNPAGEKRIISQEVAGQKKVILIKPGTSSSPMPILQPAKTVGIPSSATQIALIKSNNQVKPVVQTISQVPLSEPLPSTSAASAPLVQKVAAKPASVSAAQSRSLLSIAPKPTSSQVLQPSHNKRKQNLTEIRAEPPSVTVSQVAPELPIPPKQVDFKNFNFLSLKPLGWQDWPVALEVFIPAATQLLANYTKMFPRRDRLDIETTLHLAAHYKFLNNDSRAHVRARVHHFLKILQLEQLKRSKEGTTEDSENIEAKKKSTEKS